MGWARTLLLGDIGNRLDIGDVESDIEVLRDRLRQSALADLNQDEALTRLRAENEEMKLVVSTLVRLLAKKGLIDEDELRAVAGGAD